jgi:hypothetical protein
MCWTSEWCSSWKCALVWLVLLLSCDVLCDPSAAVLLPLVAALRALSSRLCPAARDAKETYKGSKSGTNGSCRNSQDAPRWETTDKERGVRCLCGGPVCVRCRCL